MFCTQRQLYADCGRGYFVNFTQRSHLRDGESVCLYGCSYRATRYDEFGGTHVAEMFNDTGEIFIGTILIVQDGVELVVSPDQVVNDLVKEGESLSGFYFNCWIEDNLLSKSGTFLIRAQFPNRNRNLKFTRQIKWI